MADVRVKRAYRAARQPGGKRILVDRTWPGGLAKDRLRLAEWMLELAPRDDLRRWFGHDPTQWEAFRARYAEELDGKLCAVAAPSPSCGWHGNAGLSIGHAILTHIGVQF